MARKTSDLDLVIVSGDVDEKTTLIDIKEAFDNSDLDIKVDIIMCNNVPDIMQNNILKNHFIMQRSLVENL